MNDASLAWHLLFGPVLLSTALLFKRFPPTRINGTYGYRTRRSRASQEAWDFANRYSADCMIAGGGALVVLQVMFVLLLDPGQSIIAAAVLFCVIPMLVLPVVERKLETTFQ